MFLFQNSCGKSFRRIVIIDLDRSLKDYRSCIQILVNEMHRAARNLDAVLYRLLLYIKPRKAWQ